MTTFLNRASNLRTTITFLASVSLRKSVSGERQKPSFLAINVMGTIFLVHKIFPVYIGEVLRRGMQNPSRIYGQASWRRGTLFITMLAYIYRRGFTYGVRKISPIYTGVNFK